ncbi:MAG: antitoxin [Acidovorax sp.]|uniref:antitoxin n=1 Tax=Acidovorax sp. TaxID=1872122 RepID=UPI00391D745E
MAPILAGLVVSMTEFNKNPAAVLRKANHRTVAVLNHNRPAFYVLEPHMFEATVGSLLTKGFTVRRLVDLRRKCELLEAIDELWGS